MGNAVTIQKQDPIPPGVYWVEAFNLMKGVARFNHWKKKHEKTVNVIQSRWTTPTGWDYFDMDQQYMWVLFEVKKPTPRWENVDYRLPFPNIAKAPDRVIKDDKTGAKRKATPIDTQPDDTVKKEPDEGIFAYWYNQLQDDLQEGGMVTALAIGFVVWQISKKGNR